MKTSDAATIRNIAEVLASKVMLVIRALLCIRFLKYGTGSFRPYSIKRPPVFNCTYAPKSVFTRIIHHRKFALVTRGNEQGSFK